MLKHLRLVLAAALLPPLGCGGLESGPDTGADDDDDDPDGGTPPLTEPDPADEGCSPIFDQRVITEYDVEISASEWAAMEDEFLHREERIAAGLDPHPYHPVTFRHDGVEVEGVLIRLKGNSSWRDTVLYDDPPKMQFVIAFNEVDPDRRFYGVRKVELDMPRNDPSFLRQRLALYQLRVMGLEAQCANSARLVINGAYYGLYAHLERQDKEFLQRVFPGKDDGDLWEGGREIKTNEDSFTWDRLNAYWAATDTAGIVALADLDAAVHEWAAEAMIPDGDGYYAGRPNFMLYDHPDRGFVWLADDLDATWDYLPADRSPVFGDRTKSARQHYQITMDDPAWFGRYVDALAVARDGYDIDALEARVEAWSAQIADSVTEDEMKACSDAEHAAAIDSLVGAAGRRAEYIDAWLDCRASGDGADADGDGADLCHDCDDADPTAHPGATEACNGVDDTCDGRVDEGC